MLNVKLIKISLIIFALFVFENPVTADSMKCGTKLVSPGDSKAKVLIRCGEPMFKEVVGETTVHRKFFGFTIKSSTVIVEKWTYNLGYGKFLRILTFEGDRLVRIEKGDKP